MSKLPRLFRFLFRFILGVAVICLLVGIIGYRYEKTRRNDGAAGTTLI